MPSSPVSFLMTTVSLCLVLVALVTCFSVISNVILRDSTKTQLTEIADHVAGRITELRALLHMSTSENCTLVKTLDLPQDVVMLGYTVSIEEVDGMYFVVASLDTDRSVFGQSPLWSLDDQVSVELHNGTFATEEFSVDYSGMVYSGQENASVWAREVQGVPSVGLGVMRVEVQD